ncbi:MAG: hypothetical protein KF832_21375 [Caldilineaceae bacterium]|nr:hypothetical protein [Caldilineaceae bacterium]
MSLPLAVRYYGKATSLPEQIPLRAGPLTMIYENGDLRYIKLGEQEIVRRLYVAVRDRNWGTAANVLRNVQMDIAEDSFRIRYECTNQILDIDFVWQGELRGDANGVITCTLDGKAHTTFLRNRIGFCLLHPSTIAGANAQIEHVDGTSEESRFPVHIAPQHVINGEIKPVAPFQEMQAVAHEIVPGVWAEVRFQGEIFELEDQRNWTDASYKTYGTPLRLPFPAEVKAGASIQQTVTITLLNRDWTAAQEPASTGQRKPIQLTVGHKRTPLPKIGLGVASHGQPLQPQEVEQLRALHLSHLRVDLRLHEATYAADLQRATTEARALGVALEIALHVTDQAASELQALAALVNAIKPPVATWLVFHTKEKATTAPWIALARETLTTYAPNVPIGAGTNLYFTELNRSRPPLAAVDVVAYSINPQVHAFDNASLVETLAAQATTVTSARQFCGERPLRVSPITLQPRFNPNATGPEPEPAAGELPPQVDPRQLSLFGAGWTLGSIKYLAETGEVASLTYYETTGWRGVMETQAGSALPEKFPAQPGAHFPLYYLLAAVGEFAGGVVVASSSSEPLQVEALLLEKAGRSRLLCANFTGQPQTVVVPLGVGQGQLRLLDEANVEAAMATPSAYPSQAPKALASTGDKLTFSLPPFAMACVDF